MFFGKQPWKGPLLGVLLAISVPAAAQLEDIRTRQLMQDVAELQRTVRQQALRIDQLEREISRVTGTPVARPVGSEGMSTRETEKQPWLAPKTWDRVKVGMSELEVLEILGYPTNARAGQDKSTKTLFYSVQVSPAGFLSGNVELTNNRVRVVNRPALR
jgi:hypothetical protein